ncbi:hypothetical protein [Natrinema salinisoli]|uniref:hypothetical protein n=1 Tax=Natrinema salinisoli TaxID=2878535 RepID=UPI001CF09FB3|nr:hypothetical protein [Natrinema salinisoli]
MPLTDRQEDHAPITTLPNDRHTPASRRGRLLAQWRDRVLEALAAAQLQDDL